MRGSSVPRVLRGKYDTVQSILGRMNTDFKGDLSVEWHLIPRKLNQVADEIAAQAQKCVAATCLEHFSLLLEHGLFDTALSAISLKPTAVAGSGLCWYLHDLPLGARAALLVNLIEAAEASDDADAMLKAARELVKHAQASKMSDRDLYATGVAAEVRALRLDGQSKAAGALENKRRYLLSRSAKGDGAAAGLDSLASSRRCIAEALVRHEKDGGGPGSQGLSTRSSIDQWRDVVEESRGIGSRRPAMEFPGSANEPPLIGHPLLQRTGFWIGAGQELETFPDRAKKSPDHNPDIRLS
mmetsp:Transcript_45685/g.103150  ORF Transcript_45685/g.103150 Transcript_45685/m.103150 type:complete len:298 (+) Transcript_45685:116-1009(+)